MNLNTSNAFRAATTVPVARIDAGFFCSGVRTPASASKVPVAMIDPSVQLAAEALRVALKRDGFDSVIVEILFTGEGRGMCAAMRGQIPPSRIAELEACYLGVATDHVQKIWGPVIAETGDATHATATLFLFP